MSIKDKARVLIDIRQVLAIEQRLERCKKLAKSKGSPPDTQLFKEIYKRIYDILKDDYLDEFYQKVL